MNQPRNIGKAVITVDRADLEGGWMLAMSPERIRALRQRAYWPTEYLRLAQHAQQQRHY